MITKRFETCIARKEDFRVEAGDFLIQGEAQTKLGFEGGVPTATTTTAGRPGEAGRLQGELCGGLKSKREQIYITQVSSNSSPLDAI